MFIHTQGTALRHWPVPGTFFTSILFWLGILNYNNGLKKIIII